MLYICLCSWEPFYGLNQEEVIEANKAAQFDFDLPAWEDVSGEAKDLVRGHAWGFSDTTCIIIFFALDDFSPSFSPEGIRGASNCFEVKDDIRLFFYGCVAFKRYVVRTVRAVCTSRCCSLPHVLGAAVYFLSLHHQKRCCYLHPNRPPDYQFCSPGLRKSHLANPPPPPPYSGRSRR